MNPRVFVLGVDGLNEAIWRHLRDAGLAPFLTRLITHTLPLQSTTPAHTAPAWTSIATGLNPGRHGVLNFWQRTATVPVSWRSCPLVTRAAQPFFWELAHQQGVQVGVFNYPLSYPPSPVSGYWVCGLNTPSRARDFIYPSSLAAELDFAVDVDIAGLSLPHHGRLSPRRRQVALRQITWLLRNHFTAGQRAIASVGAAPRLYVHVVTATDRLFHLFWDALFDVSHPLAAEIAEFWAALDAGVRAWLEAAQPDVVLLVSDHGAAPAPQFAFSVDRWLTSLGVGQMTGTEAFLHLPSATLLKRLVRRLLPAVASRLRNGREADALAFYAQHWPAIPEVLYGPTIGITMNVRGRQPAGLLSPAQADELLAAIAAAARDLRDAEGRNVFQAVRSAAEVWWGEYAARFPDLVLELAPPYSGAVGSSDQRMVFPVLSARLGDHAALGILGANRPLAYDAPVVWDVAGLVLDLLGAAVPSALDSRAADRSAAPGMPLPHPPGAFSAADADVIAQRLRRLGYVD